MGSALWHLPVLFVVCAAAAVSLVFLGPIIPSPYDGPGFESIGGMSVMHGETVCVRINTINTNEEVVEFLEEHGITPFFVNEPSPSEPPPNNIGGLSADNISAPLLREIVEMDSVVRVVYTQPPQSTWGIRSCHTAKLPCIGNA